MKFEDEELELFFHLLLCGYTVPQAIDIFNPDPEKWENTWSDIEVRQHAIHLCCVANAHRREGTLKNDPNPSILLG